MKQDPSLSAKRKAVPARGPLPVLHREENQFAITIKKSPSEVYAFWRDFSNLPKFMKDLAEVTTNGTTHSKWTVKLKNGLTATWDAEITEDVPGKTLAWKSVKGSSVETKGTIHFHPAPAGKGTIVLLSMDYSVPGGKLTELVAMLTGESPAILVQTNLKRLKALLETGEIPTTEGQPSGREPLDLH